MGSSMLVVITQIASCIATLIVSALIVFTFCLYFPSMPFSTILYIGQILQKMSIPVWCESLLVMFWCSCRKLKNPSETPLYEVVRCIIKFGVHFYCHLSFYCITIQTFKERIAILSCICISMIIKFSSSHIFNKLRL